MSLAKASLWTAVSTLVKIGAGLLVVKLLAVSFGPAGVGQASNFRQMITVLGGLAGGG
ncbi:lipid III flippase WzxE, partial [Salmonella enterica subsp. enterica serovar Poona]